MPTDAPINMVNPGGLPWVLDRGQVRWRDNGRVEDIRKVDGDDAADAARYGLVSGGRFAASQRRNSERNAACSRLSAKSIAGPFTD